MGAIEKVHPIVSVYKQNLAIALGTMGSKEGAAGLATVLTIFDMLRDECIINRNAGLDKSYGCKKPPRQVPYEEAERIFDFY